MCVCVHVYVYHVLVSIMYKHSFVLSGIGIQLPIVDGGHAWAITMFFSLCVYVCVSNRACYKKQGILQFL